MAFGYGGSSGYKAHAEIYEKLKAAQFVVVRFNPNNPAMSSLSFGINRSIRIILTFALTWLAFLLGVTFAIWWVFALGFAGFLWMFGLVFRSDRVLLKNLWVE